MHPPYAIESIELTFHFFLFFVAVITPVIMLFSYSKFKPGPLKTVIGFFTLAYFFGALRWIGGSMARIHVPMTETLMFNFLWTLAGILAAVFGLYAANLLFAYSTKKR